jgi:hypothetical protein
VNWVNWGNRPDKRTWRGVMQAGRRRRLTADADGQGSWEAEIVDGLVVEPDDVHVDKYLGQRILGHAAGIDPEEHG